MSRKNGKTVSTHRTEKEFWEIVNIPVVVTKEELEERNKPVDMVALEKSIEEDGIGYVTCAENYRDKIKDNITQIK